MFDKEYLSSSEKLSAFLDGELPQEDTQSLFYEIASDAELQEELRTLVSVKEMTKSSIFMPPPALKSSLDSRLGLSQDKPVAMNNQAEKAAGSAFFKNRFFLTSMAAMFSAVVMYFIMLPNAQVEQNPVQFASAKTEVTTTDTKEAAIPVVSSVENDDNYSQSNTNIIRRNNTNNMPVFSESGSYPENRNTVQIMDETQPNNFVSNFPTVNRETRFLNDISLARVDVNLPEPVFQLNNQLAEGPLAFVDQKEHIEILNRFSLEMKYNQGKSYPDLDIPVEAEPIINNVAIGLFYKYNESNSIGIEFGQENYYQRFSFKEGELVKRYEQNWMAFWGGITYNHDFGKLDLGADLYPYYRFLVGGTQIGPMFRTSLGTKIPISNKMYFVWAAEGSYMVYHFQGRSYSSSRLGMSLGFSFGL